MTTITAMTTMTTATTAATPTGTMTEAIPAEAVRLVVVDLYRDIHKGIRAELFDLTTTAGRLDPADRDDRAAWAAHVQAVAWLLDSHAHHEDEHIDPVLQTELPSLAEQVLADHDRLERRFGGIVELAAGAVDVVAVDARRVMHAAHLELAGFTSSYLAHQQLEERVIMPALEVAIGPEATLGIHGAIVGSIPPPDLARALAVMLPAMNVDDRCELLGGIRASAPPEAFDAILGLAHSVLRPNDARSLSSRLGVA